MKKLITTLAEAKKLKLTSGFVNTVVDTNTMKIVGFVPDTATFDKAARAAISDDMSTFRIDSYGARNTLVTSTVTVRGVLVVDALMAIGVGLTKRIKSWPHNFLLASVCLDTAFTTMTLIRDVPVPQRTFRNTVAMLTKE